MEQTKDNAQIQKPPISIGPAINLAWGLSLTFGHEEGQRSVGQKFVDQLKNVWNEYKDDVTARGYLDNFLGLLSACVRNIGWQKSIYIRYLEARNRESNQRVKSANDMGDITSLNTESILSRLIAIMLGGSAFTMLFSNNQIEAGQAESLGSIEPSVLWFLFGGSVGFLLVTILLKLWKSWRITRIIKRGFRSEQLYWEVTAKKGFSEALGHFARQLKDLMAEYYPEFYEKEEPLKEHFEAEAEADTDKIREFIEDKVLPINNYGIEGM